MGLCVYILYRNWRTIFGQRNEEAPSLNEDRETDLIPRRVLYGNSERNLATVSRDGQRLAFLAPVDGVMNVWSALIDGLDEARAVTNDTERGIFFYIWPYNPDYILHIQDTAGDENWHLYATHLDTNETRDLTPLDTIHARVLALSWEHPNEALVEINDRDERYHDVYRINIVTGEMSLDLENDIGATGFVADHDLNVRFDKLSTSDGGAQFLHREPSGDWQTFIEVPAEDEMTTHPLGFDSTGRTLYMIDSRRRDTSALIELNLDTLEERELAIDSRADITGFMIHPRTGVPQAVLIEYERARWETVDESIAEDLILLKEEFKGDFWLTSRSLDNTRWVVAHDQDTGPMNYYLYEREQRELKFLFANRPELEKYELSPMQSTTIESRDGLSLTVYYTMPSWGHLDSNPPPAVLLVHGGPWGRDRWGFVSDHQLWANRGYSVISVNFRGSWGFGKAFVNAGDREWAGKMHNDLLDVVDWAVETGIADRDKIAIMGVSYGGYATLVGLTFTPEVFACGVDVVGPSNLNTLLDTVPPYWEPEIAMFRTRVGDNSTEEGRQFLAERSPLTFADRIERPLLIGQGANDPRVKQAESDQIVESMTQQGIPATYVLFADEGHGFRRPENNMAFMAIAEAFLAKCLGGRFEPIGDDFDGSSVTVITGETEVPGLAEKLADSS